VLHPNTRALLDRLRASLPAPEPLPPPAPPPVASAPEPFKLTPYQPKPTKAYKAAYAKPKAPPVALAPAPDLSEFIVLDTETTGIAIGSRLVEVAALHVKDGAVVRRFQSLVNPEMHIPSVVQAVHGISDAMVAGAPTASPVLASFAKFVAGHTLIAHNASFDLRILRGEYGRVKVPTPGCAMYCSLLLARAVFPEAPNHKLGTLASFLKLPHPPTHRALADCFTTMEVLNAMAARKKSHQAVKLVGRRYDL
jgi:DNA polymerase III subunit epsilon